MARAGGPLAGAICERRGLAIGIQALVSGKSWHDALFDAVASLVLLAHLIETHSLAEMPVEALLQPDTSAWHKTGGLEGSSKFQ